MFLNLETRMWLAAGCCYSEVGKEERNLLGKVLTAEDTTKVKSNFLLSKRDVEAENQQWQRALQHSAGQWFICRADLGAESSLRFSLVWGLGRRKQGHCYSWFYFGCRVSKQMSALSFWFRLEDWFCFVALLSEELFTLLWMKLD